MPFNLSIPCPNGSLPIEINSGSSVVIVGANGGGKTRLAIHFEIAFGLRAHRISAHRALALNPSVAKISERIALNGLRTGLAHESAQAGNRISSRWGDSTASLLNDFDYLIQVLFADQSNKSLETHLNVRAGHRGSANPTKFELLDGIWKRLLPHRSLVFSGDDIRVFAPGSEVPYKATEMSDGERAIFYLIGQTLAAEADTLLIFDEPELHIHRSIMSKLWDELEAARPDCAFLFITHDLEFAASRVAQKFIISGYDDAPQWIIEEVPHHTGFSEQLATLILGSRKPILFVEGDHNSLDSAIYRCCYSEWTVVPRGSCEDVIHSVVTMRHNSELTRITCSGIVDADHYDANDISHLNSLGISVLPVSEIENLFLLPSVSRAIAVTEGYEGASLDECLNNLMEEVFSTLNSSSAIETVVARHCRRRIDRALKRIDLGNTATIAEIEAEYGHQTAALNITAIAADATERLTIAVNNKHLPSLLAFYDNKGLFALAAKHLKRTRSADFENWLTRVLRNDQVPALIEALQGCLPVVSAR